MTNLKSDRLGLAYLGESYVRLQLAKKKYRVQAARPGLPFDFMGENGARIEIKTALPSSSVKKNGDKVYEYKVWKFKLTSDKQRDNVDYYVCVTMDLVGKEPVGYFIFPKGEVYSFSDKEASGVFLIYESDINGEFKTNAKIDRYKFKDQWQLITGD